MCICDGYSPGFKMFKSMSVYVHFWYLFVVRCLVILAPSLQRKYQIVNVLVLEVIILVHFIYSPQALGIVHVHEHFTAAFWRGSIVHIIPVSLRERTPVQIRNSSLVITTIQKGQETTLLIKDSLVLCVVCILTLSFHSTKFSSMRSFIMVRPNKSDWKITCCAFEWVFFFSLWPHYNG